MPAIIRDIERRPDAASATTMLRYWILPLHSACVRTKASSLLQALEIVEQLLHTLLASPSVIMARYDRGCCEGLDAAYSAALYGGWLGTGSGH
jgi:hypothetical protein